MHKCIDRHFVFIVAKMNSPDEIVEEEVVVETLGTDDLETLNLLKTFGLSDDTVGVFLGKYNNVKLITVTSPNSNHHAKQMA